MDKFDALVVKIDASSQEDAARLLSTLKMEQCICPGCPAFSDCSRDRGDALFCLMVQDACDYTGEEPGCLCPECPVTDDFDLVKTSFCGRGTEKEQRKRRKKSQLSGISHKK